MKDEFRDTDNYLSSYLCKNTCANCGEDGDKLVVFSKINTDIDGGDWVSWLRRNRDTWKYVHVCYVSKKAKKMAWYACDCCIDSWNWHENISNSIPAGSVAVRRGVDF